MLMDLFGLQQKPKERIALKAEDETTLTYGDLCEHCRAFSQAVGSTRGLVFCLCTNTPGAVVGYLAALSSGMVPLLLGADVPEAAFKKLYETYRPMYVWAPKWFTESHDNDSTGFKEDAVALKEKVDAFKEQADGFKEKVSALKETTGSFVSVFEAYEYGLYPTGNPSYLLQQDLALLLATSGSTGEAKLVRLCGANLYANAASICSYLHLTEEERPITTLPMQYSYGLSVINSHLLAGATILLTEKSIVQQEFWQFLEKEQATSLAGVPYTYGILSRMRLFRKPWPSVKTLTQAGGKLSKQLQQEVGQWARANGVDFYVMYGQTEATARMAYLPPEECLEKLGCIGYPIPGGTFFLVDEAGNALREADTEGELVYRGENVSFGYATSPAELALGDERCKVLYTGDLAMRDGDGCYRITGRKSRFVKIFGVRISLDACEELLTKRFPSLSLVCAGADDALCIYVEDAKAANTPAAELTEASAERPTEIVKASAEQTVGLSKVSNTPAAELTETLAQLLDVNRKAIMVRFIKKIPKNAAGKVQYQALAELENTFLEKRR